MSKRRIQSYDQVKSYERVEIQGKTILIPWPAATPEYPFIGREEIIRNAQAAWLRTDICEPLNFRIYGPPGVGKNAIVYELGRILKKDVYIINGHDELGPEDIACTATMSSRNTIEYVASPLLAAMLRPNSICFIDELGKAPQSALDPLASVLDDRRSITSVLAGIHVKAHPDFLFCAALNEDEETGVGLPGFIDERTRPSFFVGYPRREEMEEILRSRLGNGSHKWAEVLVADFFKADLSTRTALTLLRHAYNQAVLDERKPGSLTKSDIREYLSIACKGAGVTASVEVDRTSKKPAKKRDSGGIERAFTVATDDKETIH